jgi:hypothetical protein
MALRQNCFNFPEASNTSGALSRFLLMAGHLLRVRLLRRNC